MSLVLNDRVLETCTSPGTGSCILLGAATGFRTFSAGVGNGNTCYYTIADQNGGNWEVGLGTYTSSSNSLARTTVLSSSNSGSLVNFNSDTQNVFVTYPAEKAVYLDASGNLTLSGSVTLSGGTANGVLYLNGSDVISSGTALSFDGTNLSTTGNIISSLGHYAKGTFSGTYSDGIVLDYVSGLGRISVGSSDGLSIYNGGVGGTALLNLDSNGNLGLGTTTSAWTVGKAVEVGTLGNAFWSAGNANTVITSNVYYNGGYKYAIAAPSSQYQQYNGAHTWYTAPSGTAGGTLLFTQAMTLDASGNLSIGDTSPTGRFKAVVSNNAAFQLAGSFTNNTNADFQINIQSFLTQVGTSVSVPLAFATNATERARIDSSGNFGIGTTSPNASAILDVQSTTLGVRFPNMTSTQKNAISSPAAGLVVFDTTLAKLCVYSGAAWQTITSI